VSAPAVAPPAPVQSIFSRAMIANGRFNLLGVVLVAVVGYPALAEIGKFILRHTVAKEEA
jgi:hypothetical protein